MSENQGASNEEGPRRSQRGPPPGYDEQPEQQEAQGSSEPRVPPPPPVYTPQEPEPPRGQHRSTPQTAQEAIDILDKIPVRDWGNEVQKEYVVLMCNLWREENPQVDSWLAHNLLMMDEDAFKNTLDSNGHMTGAYRFCAYVRLQNWMFYSDEQKRVIMELGDLTPPNDPEVPNLMWFHEHRHDHQFFDVTDDMAREFLDQDTVETMHLFESFEASFDWTKEAIHWIAANIALMNSELVIKDDRAIRKAKKPAKKRMRNWMKLHFTWRQEFMTIAFVPITRKPAKWDPNQNQRLDCLQDPPSANPRLESAMNQLLAEGYLSQDSTCSFSEEQTEFLFNIWMVNNPKHRVWADKVIVPRYYKVTLSRMRNWLIMDPGWKKHFIERIVPRI